MKKIISLLLAVMLVISAVPMAYAADTQDYSLGTAVKYTAANNENYTITVPAKLAPGGSGTVTLEGYWPSDATVKVTAEEKVEVVNNINSADKKELAVTFASIEKAGSNTAIVTASAPVSVANIENALFGKWAGKFNYNVEYDGEAGGSGTVTPTPDPEQPSDPDDGGAVEPGEGQISFTIDSTTYLADEDMTWEEWVESEYNTIGCLAADSKYTTGGDYRIIINSNKNKCIQIAGINVVDLAQSPIVSGHNYEFVSISDKGYTLVEPEANLITFTINGTEYQAEEGITWREWIETENNVLGIRLSDNGKWLVWGDVGGGAIVKNGAVPDGATDVLSDDVIDTNGTYSFAVD